MKATELIKRLQELVEKHGDCELLSLIDYEGEPIDAIEYKGTIWLT